MARLLPQCPVVGVLSLNTSMLTSFGMVLLYISGVVATVAFHLSFIHGCYLFLLLLTAAATTPTTLYFEFHSFWIPVG